MNLQAVVLAGGFGTRLRSVSGGLPKALLPVAGRPFVERVLERLRAHGFVKVALALGYKSESIRSHLGSSFQGLDLAYHVERTPLGTGGAIVATSTLLDAAPFFALNGDTWLDVDYAAMAQAHCRGAGEVTIATIAVEDVARYGAVEVDGARIIGFREKGEHTAGLINGGVYLIERDVLDSYEPGEAFSFERDVLQRQVAALKLLSFPGRSEPGAFIDIGVPGDLERAQTMFPQA